MTPAKIQERAELVRVARTSTSLAHLMLHDAIDQAVVEGHHAPTATEAQADLKRMFLHAMVSEDYHYDLAKWTAGHTSTLELRDLYARTLKRDYMDGPEVRNVVNMIDNAWLAVKIAKEQLEQQAPVAQLAVKLGANLFDIVAETDDRFATGFCAGSTHMMRAYELAQFQEILAEQRAERAAAPDEDDMRP